MGTSRLCISLEIHIVSPNFKLCICQFPATAFCVMLLTTLNASFIKQFHQYASCYSVVNYIDLAPVSEYTSSAAYSRSSNAISFMLGF